MNSVHGVPNPTIGAASHKFMIFHEFQRATPVFAQSIMDLDEKRKRGYS